MMWWTTKAAFAMNYEDLIFDRKTPAQFLKDMDAMDAALDEGYGNDKGYGKGYG